MTSTDDIITNHNRHFQMTQPQMCTPQSSSMGLDSTGMYETLTLGAILVHWVSPFPHKNKVCTKTLGSRAHHFVDIAPWGKEQWRWICWISGNLICLYFSELPFIVSPTTLQIPQYVVWKQLPYGAICLSSKFQLRCAKGICYWQVKTRVDRSQSADVLLKWVIVTQREKN